jgi:sulfur carrier protein
LPGVVVVVNGDGVELADGATVVDLIAHLRLGSKWVLVERNGRPVDRADRGATVLVDGDRIELVRAVAGG